MQEQVSGGFLVLADISGYTKYLTGVELEHSHDILADLLGLVAEQLCPPLTLAKLEGDAVFCFTREGAAASAGDGDAPRAQELLAALERTYVAFARRRRTVALSSSCACDACRRVPELDLKLCAHRGSFIEHDVAGSRELVGPDVILAHRLLKNSVSEKIGLCGYALLTDACDGAIASREDVVAYVERYEDVGEVRCQLVDLEQRWRAEQDEARGVVSREDADLLFEADVDAPPAAVWDAMTDPAQGMRWRVGVTDIQEQNSARGRGVGTVTHCVHGRTTIEQEIVDWRPPHHLSFSERNPIGRCHWTMTLAPLRGGEHTHLEWRIAMRGGRRQAVMMRVVGARARKIMRANFDAFVAYVRAASGPAHAGTLTQT
jgi:uncharacterized protein YndB with AHSA1/START domain